MGTLPLVGPAGRRIYLRLRSPAETEFTTSAAYWEQRYAQGGNSGRGSYGRLAEFKAEVLNAFVVEHSVTTVNEFGVGDGNQLSLATYPLYVGYDVVAGAVEACRDQFAGDASKSFWLVGENSPALADLAISLDVVFHLLEDDAYEAHMIDLFDSSSRFVCVYASDYDAPGDAPHVRHRKFTSWVERERPEWRPYRYVSNPFHGDGRSGATSFSNFHFFERR